MGSQSDEDRRIWRQFRHHSRTFSLATRLLPPSVQMPIATLYLFCRRVDTIADQRILLVGRERAQQELRVVEQQLHQTLDGRPPDLELWHRLAEVDRRFALDPVPLQELIDGAAWDLEDRPIRDEDDLIAYSGLVGGSVGAMMLPFLTEGSVPTASLEGPARRLGVAMQITNIVRDVGEDARMLGRVYVPATWLAAHGLTVDDLREERAMPPTYPALIETVMEAAEERYRAALPGIDALPVQARLGIRAAARMYREIMNEVRRLGYDNLGQRAYVPLRRKLRLLVDDGYERRKARLLTRFAALPT